MGKWYQTSFKNWTFTKGHFSVTLREAYAAG